ncbi:MAG: hypothetical protein D3920_12660 [Candidatus Electrothrix sp. AW2]|nr:hypothetical protein [Candidatus Electrothrix gigas]
MDIDNDGNVHVAFSNGTVGGDPTGTNHIWYASSLSNWTNVQVDSDVTGNWWDDRINPSINVDSDNTVHIVWEDHRNTALSGDPAYQGGLPNRTEIYYANSSNAWTNAEIALPIDTAGPRVKTSPAIYVQNNSVHVSWIQTETDDWVAQGNLFYSNSNNWDSAVNISNNPDSPITDPDMPGSEMPSSSLGLSQHALSVDEDGNVHVTWIERDNSNNTYNIFYASSPSFNTACGNGRDLPANTWLMTAPSCTPSPTGINDQYGTDLGGTGYNNSWISFEWLTGTQKYNQQAGTDPLALGVGNWNYSFNAGTLTLSGTATPTEDCSIYGPGLTGQCFAIDLVPSAGAALWQIVGHPFPYTANWADVRVAAFDGTTWTQRTPSEAETADLMLKTFWRWTGSAYESHDDSTPGMLGILQPQESFWVRILPGSSDFNVEGIKLLIPAR